MPREEAQEIINWLYVEIINETIPTNSLTDNLDLVENHLATLKGIQLTMTVEDLAKIPLPLYTAINGFLNKNNTNGLVLHAVNSKLIESDYECITLIYS